MILKDIRNMLFIFYLEIEENLEVVGEVFYEPDEYVEFIGKLYFTNKNYFSIYIFFFLFFLLLDNEFFQKKTPHSNVLELT